MYWYKTKNPLTSELISLSNELGIDLTKRNFSNKKVFIPDNQVKHPEKYFDTEVYEYFGHKDDVTGEIDIDTSLSLTVL